MALVLFAAVLVYPEVPPEGWIAFALFVASFGALSLYLLSLDDILIGWYYRRLVRDRYGQVLFDQFREHAESTRVHADLTDTLRHDFVNTMVQNAVSSSPIRHRILRVRVLGYFLISYPFYVVSGFILLERLEEVLLGSIFESIIVPIENTAAVLATLLFFALLFVGFWKRAFTSRLDRDISYVASYLYRRSVQDLSARRALLTAMSTGSKISPFAGKTDDSLVSDLDYLDRLLIRNELDIFVIMWHNILKPNEDPQEKPPVYTSFRDCRFTRNSLIVFGLAIGAFLMRAPMQAYSLFTEIIRLVLVPLWVSLLVVWLFRMYGYKPVRFTIFFAGLLSAASLCPSTIMWLKYLRTTMYEALSISDLAACQAYLLLAAFFFLGMACIRTHLFRIEEDDDEKERLRLIPGPIFVVASFVSIIISLVRFLPISIILGSCVFISFLALLIVLLYVEY